ncbi:hypothetical protein JR316_0005500 [Psilocybe cubensis]|nr:hypothetical protein JR316_0005500 [Psilocybe cubensis]KAH9480982.1 hypothetical protein JR316_0005500 [Psilocybe cubensis]
MSYNTSTSSNIMLAQNGADNTEAVNHYPLSGVDGTSADIRQPLIPDMFEYWGITPRNHISNVVDKRLQDGNAVSPRLGVTHGPLNHESAAQGTAHPVSDLSLDWTKLGDIDFSLMNEYLNDPAAMTWTTPLYHPPIFTQMGNTEGELSETLESSSLARQESSNDSNIGRTMSHAPINNFERIYAPDMGAISAPIFPSQRNMSVGPSRQQTSRYHHRYSPHTVCNITMPNPLSGEIENQNPRFKKNGHDELNGSGFTPVEPTSTRNAGSSGNSRRSEHQSKPESGSLIRKRAPRSSSGGASQGGKRAERIVRIDKYGNVVYKGMRPDVRTPREIEQ